MFTTINDKRTTSMTTTKRKSTIRSSPSRTKLGLFLTFLASVLLVSTRLKIEKIFVSALEHEHHHHQRMPPPTRPPPPHREEHHEKHRLNDENRKKSEQERQKQKPPPPPPTGRMHSRKVDPPLNPNEDVDAQKEQQDPIPATIPTEKKRMTAQEYVEARKEMKPPSVSGKQQKNFMNEMVSSVLAPGYKFAVGLPKNSVKFVVKKFTTMRATFRVHAIAVLSKLPMTRKMDVNKFGGYLADAFLLLFTLAVLRIVHLFTPFAKPPPASVKTRKVGSDRVNIQFHMPFAGGADKCIVFLKGNKVLCRCPEKMLECETTLSAPAKGSTWIIFEEPKWLEYKDELVVVAKSVKKDKEAKKIEKMPLKTPAARKKSASRTTDEGEEDRAPAKARASRKTTKATTTTKKTPAARAKSPASPRRTRQTPAKKK
jgi:hypothetical protein